jgi:hypothetical protein
LDFTGDESRKRLLLDHTKALKHGGSDTPDNMEWQTKAEAKEKDRVEGVLNDRSHRS